MREAEDGQSRALDEGSPVGEGGALAKILPLHVLGAAPEMSSELLTTLTIAINIAGGGLLVLPLAMHHASVVTGMALLCVCSVATVFTANTVVLGCVMTGATSLPESFARVVVGPDTVAMNDELHAQKLRRRRRLSTLLDAVVALYSQGMLIMYVRVVADICVDAAGAFTTEEAWLDHSRYFGASFLLFFLLTCMRQLSELAWSTIFGLITVLLTAFAMLIEYSWFSFSKQRLAHGHVRWFDLDASVSLALPVITVALGYHYNAPAMYAEMEDATPRKFSRAVSAATVLCTVLYASVGLAGYFTFGPHVEDAASGGNIINNYARGDRLMAFTRIALACHIVCVFPVIAISVRDAVHRLSLRLVGNHEGAEHPDAVLEAHRSIVVLEAALVCGVAVVTAVKTPGIGFFVDIIGVVFGILLVFLAPAVMGLAIHGGVWRNDRGAQQRLAAVGVTLKPRARYELINLLIAACGAAALIVGLLSVLGLIHTRAR